MPAPTAKLCLALRRSTPTGPLEWKPVRGIRRTLPGYTRLDLFTYRDGPAVFLVDHLTGLHIATDASVPTVLNRAIVILKGMPVEAIREILTKELEFVNPGPKPNVRLKKYEQQKQSV